MCCVSDRVGCHSAMGVALGASLLCSKQRCLLCLVQHPGCRLHSVKGSGVVFKCMHSWRAGLGSLYSAGALLGDRSRQAAQQARLVAVPQHCAPSSPGPLLTVELAALAL